MVTRASEYTSLQTSEPESNSVLEPGTNLNLRDGNILLREDGSYSYSYGPPGLAGLLQNRFALACAVFASLGGLTFGYDQV